MSIVQKDRNHSPPQLRSGASLTEREPIVAMTSREGITLSDIFTSLRRHVVLVLAATIAIGALAALSVFRENPTYRATATLRLTDTRSSMTGALGTGPADPRQGTNPMLSQIQFLKSKALIGAVVDSVGLRLHPVERGFSASVLSQVRVDPGVVQDTFFLAFSNDGYTVRNGSRDTRVAYNAPYQAVGVSFAVTAKPPVDRGTLVLSPREQTIDDFIVNLRVTPRDETNVVDVSFSDAVPQVAQRVVNTLVSEFQDVDIRQAQGESRRRRIFLAEQLREIDGQLSKSEGALASFRSREQVFSSREKFQAQQTALMTLDIRREELDADRRVYESLMQKLQQATGTQKDDELRTLIAAPDVSTNPVVSQLYQQLARYQTSRDSLTTGEWRSAPGNPDVARLDQLISSTEQRLLGAVRGQIATIDVRRDALGTLRTRNAAAIEALPRAESAEERLVRQVESNRLLADRLKDEYQKARLAEAVEAGQVEVLDLASLPYRPIARLRTLRLLLGVLVGLTLGVLGALLIDSTNARVRRRVDIEEEMRVPVLAVIPRIMPEADGHSLRRLSARLVSKRGNGRADADGSVRPQSAAAFMTPAGSEAFRLLRSSLKWAQRDGSGKTLVISSALSEEGKTTTSANLAVVYALEGKRVLLIDCDLRRPRLHQVFRVPRSPGVAQVLREDIGPAAAVRDTFFHGLSFLPAGRDTGAGLPAGHPAQQPRGQQQPDDRPRGQHRDRQPGAPTAVDLDGNGGLRQQRRAEPEAQPPF